ncbi:MAG TPA: ABC transporter substrate-binding protein, partial [Nannocystis sp.]
MTIGCGDEPTMPADPGPASVEAAAEDVPVADTVVIALRRLPAALDPTAELDPWGQRVVDDLLFEGLTRRLPDAPWAEPALADRCEVEHEGRGVACRLRPGARFHDDQPVTIEDVLYSINLWLGPRGANMRQRYGLDDLKSVEAGSPPGAEGGPWVRIGFAGRDPLVLERLAAIKVVPRARHAGPGRFSQKPIGTGPMALVSQTEERLIFARREPVPGRARQIELRVQADGAMALTALRRGEIHMLPEVAPAHVPRELGKPGMAARFSAFLLSPPRYDLILYNLREGPQAGPRMRGALDLSIPRVEIATTVHGVAGLATAAPVDLTVPTAIDLVAIAEARIDDAG